MAVWTFRTTTLGGFGATQGRTNHGTALSTNKGHIYRSTDGGATWTLSVILPFGGSGVVSPLNTSGHWGANTTAAGYGVANSTDDGVTFPSHTGLTPFSMAAVAFDGVSTAIFLDASGNMQWTTDGGTTWGSGVAPWNGGSGAIQSGGLIWDGTRFVALYCNPAGSPNTGAFYTAPGGFTQLAGPVFSLAQAYSRFDSGIAPGNNGDAALAFDPQTGYYATNGQDASGNASYLSATTLAALATAPIVTPSVLAGLGHVAVGVWLLGSTDILVADAGGNLAHSTDGGATWALDTLNFAVAGERVVSIINDTNHNTLIATGGQGSISTLPFTATTTVPNVVGDPLATGEAAIVAAGLIVGTVTTANSGSIPAGDIISTSPAAGAIVAVGSSVNIVESLGPIMVTVPNVVGLTQAAAQNNLTTVGLANTVVTAYSTTVPVGKVIAQSPIGGTSVVIGSNVALEVSLGPQLVVVPNVINDPIGLATEIISMAGLALGIAAPIIDFNVVFGCVAAQDLRPGTMVPAGSTINLSVSAEVLPFNVDATVISQYSNSSTLLQLVENMSVYVDPRENILNFFNLVWNVDTAVGFGLDIWGRIVGVNRVIPIPGTSGTFGFENTDSPPDWENFGNGSGGVGGPFFSGQVSTGSFTLNDASFRILILTKALANICATTSPALNQLITNLFKGRGRCYVRDGGQSNASAGGMTMTYVFEFSLTTVESAILKFSGVLPHPAGVLVSILEVAQDTFGFEEQGAGVEPLNFGPFFNG